MKQRKQKGGVLEDEEFKKLVDNLYRDIYELVKKKSAEICSLPNDIKLALVDKRHNENVKSRIASLITEMQNDYNIMINFMRNNMQTIMFIDVANKIDYKHESLYNFLIKVFTLHDEDNLWLQIVDFDDILVTYYETRQDNAVVKSPNFFSDESHQSLKEKTKLWDFIWLGVYTRSALNDSSKNIFSEIKEKTNRFFVDMYLGNAEKSQSVINYLSKLENRYANLSVPEFIEGLHNIPRQCKAIYGI